MRVSRKEEAPWEPQVTPRKGTLQRLFVAINGNQIPDKTYFLQTCSPWPRSISYGLCNRIPEMLGPLEQLGVLKQSLCGHGISDGSVLFLALRIVCWSPLPTLLP